MASLAACRDAGNSPRNLSGRGASRVRGELRSQHPRAGNPALRAIGECNHAAMKSMMSRRIVNAKPRSPWRTWRMSAIGWRAGRRGVLRALEIEGCATEIIREILNAETRRRRERGRRQDKLAILFHPDDRLGAILAAVHTDRQQSRLQRWDISS